MDAAQARVFAAPALWWRVAIILPCVFGVMAQEWRLAFFATLSVIAVTGYFSIVLSWMVRPSRGGGVALGLLEVVLANAVIAAGVIGLDRPSTMLARGRNAGHGAVRVESGDQHRSGITGELPEEQGASPQ